MMIANARIKRLLVLFGIVLAIGLLRPVWGHRYDLLFDKDFNSDLIYLEQIEEHIRAIRPQWYSFTNQNAGFELVRFGSHTGNDGMFVATGYVPTDEHIQKLKVFLEGTKPPRPISLANVDVCGQEMFDTIKTNEP